MSVIGGKKMPAVSPMDQKKASLIAEKLPTHYLVKLRALLGTR